MKREGIINTQLHRNNKYEPGCSTTIIVPCVALLYCINSVRHFVEDRLYSYRVDTSLTAIFSTQPVPIFREMTRVGRCRQAGMNTNFLLLRSKIGLLKTS